MARQYYHDNKYRSLDDATSNSSGSSSGGEGNGGRRGDEHVDVIGAGTDSQLTVYGFRRSVARCVMFGAACLLLGLTPLLLTRWRPKWRILLTHRACPLRSATKLLATDCHGQCHVVSVIACPATHAVPASYVIDTGPTREAGASPRGTDGSCSHSWRQSGDLTDGLACQINQPLLTHKLVLKVRYFWFVHLKYTWNEERACFEQLSGLDHGCSVHQLLDTCTGFSEQQQRARLSLYGDNQMRIAVKSYASLLVDEALNPFYVFQVFSIVLWCLDQYYVYASCIAVISLISIGVTLYETRRQSKVLCDMIASSSVKSVTIRRNSGHDEVIDSQCLVPGDLLVLPPNGCIMPCDAALVTGTCIVNEAMLTGESVPVTKTALCVSEDGEMYSPQQHSRNTLFGGTQVIQTRFYGESPVLAVVVRTGFSTAKGELVRSILFPKPLGFKFYRDSMKFLGVLAVVAVIGMIYTLYLYIIRGASIRDVVLRCLDVVTVVVPPALPAAMTVGTVYAQNRLKHQRIFCISPPRINIAGKVKLFCFDKTGTLTEDGLSTWGVAECCYSVCGGGPLLQTRRCVAGVSDSSTLKMALASCHTLTRLDDQLIGDPLDIEMFQSTGWELEEPVVSDSSKYDLLAPTVVRAPQPHPEPPADSGPPACTGGSSLCESGSGQTVVRAEVGILRHFAFSSGLQRMCVITRTLGSDHMNVYCKGAPEKIESLCSDVPDNFHAVLHEYAVQGYRVLAVAHKALSRKIQWHHVQRLKRDQVECELQMCGLLIMQNKLKSQTQPVISILQKADIRCVMVTGDNLLTAVSVGRECGMIGADSCAIIVDAVPPTATAAARLVFTRAAADSLDCDTGGGSAQMALGASECPGPYHLVTTGRAWRVIRQHFPNMVDRLIVKGTIFARMAPEQKAQLIEALQRVGYTVGMCGDGANDCEALRAAHVGVSLSEAEASVAAPFTSASSPADITCVPRLIGEGRCALTTSFATFKYMALYSVIQFVSVLLLYSRYSNLSDVQFLHVDLVITTSVAVTMGYTGAAPGLHRRRPPGSLLSVATLLSILLQVSLVVVCQLLALWLLQLQPWYQPLKPSRGEGHLLCWENTVVFSVSAYQYLILSAAFSRGAPYRRPFYTNPLFLSSLLVLSALQTVLVLVPYPPLASFFGLISPETGHPSSFLRHFIIYLTIGHCCAAFAIEFALSDVRWLKKILRFCGHKPLPKNAYKLVCQQLLHDPHWPPLQHPLLASDTVISVN